MATVTLHSRQIGELIDEAAGLLHHLPNPRFEAEALLAHLLEKNRAYFRTWPETVLEQPQIDAFAQLVEQRRAGKPLAYITGEQPFWSFELKVTGATLIPRPETELLVEKTLALIPPTARWQIADLGTGSGAIALALASERPQCQLHASDISPDALDIARLNAGRIKLGNIRFSQGNWCEALAGEVYQIIVSNPPYVDADDPHLLEDGLPFEPRLALTPGSDGLAAIDQIIDQARHHLVAPGWLLLEHGYHQRAAIQALLREAGYSQIETFTDLGGNDRLTIGRFINSC